MIEEIKRLLQISLDDVTKDDLINDYYEVALEILNVLSASYYEGRYLELMLKFLAAHLYTLGETGLVKRESIGSASVEYNVALDSGLRSTQFGVMLRELDYKKTLQRDDNKRIEFVIL